MSFFTAINCMDGRVQEPVIKYIKQTFNVKFVDMITDAGPVKTLACADANQNQFSNRIEISLYKHGSQGIAIIAHYDCAGNPISETNQKAELNQAKLQLQKTYTNTIVVALWVSEKWRVEVVE